jgi:hypothetical protein
MTVSMAVPSNRDSVFFFSLNLWGRYVGDHPQEDLAKLGYRTEESQRILKIPTIYFGNMLETYCLNMTNSKKKLSQWNNLGP